jgi:hypothetical protein
LPLYDAISCQMQRAKLPPVFHYYTPFLLLIDM